VTDRKIEKADTPGAANTEGVQGPDVTLGWRSMSTPSLPLCEQLVNPPVRIIGDTWVQRRSARYHLVSSPPAWRVWVRDLDQAESMGARFVEILDNDYLRVYRTTTDKLRWYSLRYCTKTGDQFALELCYWQTFLLSDVEAARKRDTEGGALWS
jgi:hypothetical protein